MSKVRVYEIAKQLNMDQKSLVALFQSMGIGDVRNHMSAVESDVVDRVRRHLERQKTPEVVEERIRPTVVKRRAKAVEPGEGPASVAVPSARPSQGGAPPASSAAPSSRGTTRPLNERVAFSPAPSSPGSTTDAAPRANPSNAGSVGPAHAGSKASQSASDANAAPAAAKSAPGHASADGSSKIASVGGAPVGSAPVGSAPVGSAPVGSAPVGSAAVGSAAAGGAAAGGGAPLGGASVVGKPPSGDAVGNGSSSGRSSVAGSSSAAGDVAAAAPGSRRGASAPAEEAAPSARGAKEPSSAKASATSTSVASAEARVTDLDFDAVARPSRGSSRGQAEQPQGEAAAAHEQSAAAPAAAPSVRETARAENGSASAAQPVADRKSARGSSRQAVPPPSETNGESAHKNGEQAGSVPYSAPAVVPPPPPVASSAPPRSQAPAAAAGAAVSRESAAPQRPSSPPRTGIDVWQGRPGVPMPQTRSSAPPARRTTYDPRAAAAPQRPGAPTMGGFPQNRGGPAGQRNRPGFRRPGMGPIIKKPVNISTLEMSAHKKVIKIEENVTLQQMAAKMSLKVTDVLMRLLSMGMTGVNINSSIDSDTAKILASEFGWVVEDVAVSEEATLADAMGITEVVDSDTLVQRPPIVTVMGHVDHGKTSLLDRIRKATVAAGEAGGITQHIGAYRVETSRGTLAFLDTPGHEAFTAMRARGAQATDIVILVVAADDGVMPQTREAIAHATAAKVPIVVAVNKIDKPGADLEKIKRDLANLGLQPEEWGGQTIFAPVSALTGEGVDALLEAVLLQAEVLELRASPLRRANGVVIEALLDRGRGPVARIMVQDGTLRAGDIVIAGSAWGKVRAMTDEHGRTLASAGPSTPVEILGLNEVPSAGDPVHAVKDGKTAEEIAETRRKKANKSLIPQDSRVSLEALKDRLAQEDQLELKLIIKGDVQGSVEAVGASLIKLTTPKVKVTIVHAAVGAITEGDVGLGIAAKAIIVGFNVRPAGKASALAASGGVEIRLYNIIYNAVDDIRSAMEGLLPTTKIEKPLGKADVRQVFRISKVGVVAGCYITTGSVKRGCDARLLRDTNVVWSGKVSSVRRVKDDVKEVSEGMECGISLGDYTDIKEGDIIEAFEVEEIKTKL